MMRIFIFENGLRKPPVEYSQYLIYPYNAEYSHDNALGAASVTLRNTDREETFAPGTVVMIGDGSWKDNTCDQWVIVNTARGANHANHRYTHTLYLCDVTKLLEREMIGNKTFTRPLMNMDEGEPKLFTAQIIDSTKDFVDTPNENLAHTPYYCVAPAYHSPVEGSNWMTWPSFASVFPKEDKFDDIPILLASRTVRINGKIWQRRAYELEGGYSVITNPDGSVDREQMSFSQWYANDQAVQTLELPRSGVVEATWQVVGGENTRTVHVAIYAKSANEDVKQKSLFEACQILADITDMTRLGIYPTVRTIGEIAERNLAADVPDIDISGGTLREAIDIVASVGGCFCRYKLEYDAESAEILHYIDLHPISSRERADLAPLGSPVVRKMEDSIEGACSALDSTVSNLVSLSDSGTVCEPTDEAWTSLRSEDVRITEETAEIPTSYPVYRIEKLEVLYDKYEADITKYVVEKSAYDLLSSFAPAYPRSKAYALYYQRGHTNVKGLSFEQQNAISQGFESPSIVNICNAEFGTSFKDYGLKDGMLYYPNLLFRITYVPIINARVRQAKPDMADNLVPNILGYNQSANYVDSMRYGRNMAGAVERGGQPGKTLIYKVSNAAKLPKPGQLYDEDYTISKISVQRGKDMQTVQLNLARYYNRLNPFIGIDSAPRLFEISELGHIDRNVIYEDFCVIGDTVGGNVYDALITADGLTGFAQSIVSGVASGRYTATVAIVKGNSDLAGAELRTCVLPINSMGLGRSLVYTFGYKDNYLAGDKAIEAENYTELYRLKEAVPYADDFGEITTLSLTMADSSNTAGLSPDDLPQDTSNNDYRAIFAGTIPVYKDSRECIKMTYQLHFVTNNGWIISPGMAEDFKMITRKSKALSRKIRLYRLDYELSRTDSTIDMSRATQERYYRTSGAISGYVESIPVIARAIDKVVRMDSTVFGTHADVNKFTGTGKAWAVAYDDGKLLFGNNEPITTSTALPNINFSFRHMIEV